jgi:hypothetical protein
LLLVNWCALQFLACRNVACRDARATEEVARCRVALLLRLRWLFVCWGGKIDDVLFSVNGASLLPLRENR